MKHITFILLLTGLFSFDRREEPDYKKEFGKNYVWAKNWMQQHSSLIETYARSFGVPAKELKSIAFPELIRYNGLMNVLETESLKYLYVSEGKQYADFSIGYFQMKPSFAESVEQDALQIIEPALLQRLGGSTAAMLTNEESNRKSRVQRLSNINDQIVYLCMFYKICESRFRDKRLLMPVQRLRTFATCYNAGYQLSYERLLSYQSKKHFLGHNYSAVSVYYYLNE